MKKKKIQLYNPVSNSAAESPVYVHDAHMKLRQFIIIYKLDFWFILLAVLKCYKYRECRKHLRRGFVFMHVRKRKKEKGGILYEN